MSDDDTIIKPSATDTEEVLRAARYMFGQTSATGTAAEQYATTISSLVTLYQSGKLKSLAPILPLLLTLKGRPYSLHDHFPVEPLFSTQMPRSFVFVCGRQISKSTTLAAQSCVQAAAIPYFSALYVAPRFEQTRRFSNNYIRPFLKDTTLGNAALAPDAEQSVLQRSFKNGSVLHFSYAFLDADRIRGIAADKVAMDECVTNNIDILTPKGYVKFKQCKPEDPIVGFNVNRQLVYDRIKTIVHKGWRETWRVTLTNGATIECTKREKLFTNYGWVYLEDILNACIRHDESRVSEYDPTTTAGSTGHAARGWLHAVEWCKIWKILHNTWCKTRSVLSPQSKHISKLHSHAANSAHKQRLGETQLRICNSNNTSFRVYSAPVLPQEQADQEVQKNSYKSVAPKINMGGSGLLVHGRRDASDARKYCNQHTRVPGEGGSSNCTGADPQRHFSECPTRQEGSISLLGNAPDARCQPRVYCKDKTIQSSRSSVQIRHNTTWCDYLRSLWQTGAAALFKSACMFRPGMSSRNTSRSMLHVRRGAPAADTRKRTSAMVCRHNEESCPSRKASTATPTGSDAPCRAKCCKVCLACAEEGRESGTPQNGNMSVLRCADPEGPASHQQHDCVQQPRVQTKKTQNNMSALGGELIPCSIASIEYIGVNEVFDIETYNHHTFIAGGIAVHNCQDLDSDFIPVINETLSASEYNLRQYAGTPKTLDNTLQGLWEESSQAEWIIPCACGYWNIASIEFDLLAMIQKQGLSCAKCGKLINSEEGHWEHKYLEKRVTFAGYHIPQPIMPMHYRPDKQTGLMEKWELLWAAKTGMDKAKFWNEKLGESCDVRVSLLTRSDMQNASTLTHTNDLRAALRLRNNYAGTTMGIDWGGGGIKGVSHTALAVLGHRPDGKSDVIYGERLANAGDHADEAALVLHYMRAFNCTLLAHDFGGAGAVRETLLIQAGLPLTQIFPAAYVRACAANMVTYKEPSGNSTRHYYSVDKARSLVMLCQLIKHGIIRFPEFKSWESLADDFLALVEDKHEMPRGPDAYLVTSKANKSDDFAHAVNFAGLAWWHYNRQYPDLAGEIGIRLTHDQIADILPASNAFVQ